MTTESCAVVEIVGPKRPATTTAQNQVKGYIDAAYIFRKADQEMRWKLLRNRRALFNPLAHFRAELRVRQWWLGFALCGVPARFHHETVVRDVVDNFFQCLAAVLFRVFQLASQFRGA